MEKPGTRNAANANKTPFITNVNKPSVNIFSGSVKNNKIGLIKALIILITKTAIIRENKFVITIPLNINTTMINASALSKNLVILLC